ncbi:MAG: MBL fold metallo-hydrolase [Gammaproteobacteria bacterium]|nr:MBL fold metallo-hydrolase [Gammaproteobacteria bacterium]
MQITVVPVTEFKQNCSVVWCGVTRQAAVVDPGGDLERVLSVLRMNDLQLTKILITHGHLDHAAGTAELAQAFKVPIEGPHLDDNFWIEQIPAQARIFGFPETKVFTPTRWLQEGDQVSVGNINFKVLHCPGHTPGHVVFFESTTRYAIVGDVIFSGSIGRTDFPRGNHEQLLHSIRQKLFPLGNDVIFFPGHGPTSTFGKERKNNPFVGDHIKI